MEKWFSSCGAKNVYEKLCKGYQKSYPKENKMIICYFSDINGHTHSRKSGRDKDFLEVEHVLRTKRKNHGSTRFNILVPKGTPTKRREFHQITCMFNLYIPII